MDCFLRKYVFKLPGAACLSSWRCILEGKRGGGGTVLRKVGTASTGGAGWIIISWMPVAVGRMLSVSLGVSTEWVHLLAQRMMRRGRAQDGVGKDKAIESGSEEGDRLLGETVVKPSLVDQAQGGQDEVVEALDRI